MNLHLTSATTVARKQARNQRLGALGGLALALALAAGIGAWQIAGQPDTAMTGVPSTAMDVSATTARTMAPIVYIVSSWEDMELLRRVEEEANRHRHVAGLPSIRDDVLVTDLDAAVIAELPATPGTTFVDLRTP
jgi:hypothetical protein